MKKLSQLQYEVIFLYSKGLTFKEIDTALTTASKGVYSQVVSKDKGRVSRAKKSRETNLNSYKIELIKYIDEVKINFLPHYYYLLQLNHFYKSFFIDFYFTKKINSKYLYIFINF